MGAGVRPGGSVGWTRWRPPGCWRRNSAWERDWVRCPAALTANLPAPSKKRRGRPRPLDPAHRRGRTARLPWTAAGALEAPPAWYVGRRTAPRLCRPPGARDRLPALASRKGPGFACCAGRAKPLCGSTPSRGFAFSGFAGALSRGFDPRLSKLIPERRLSRAARSSCPPGDNRPGALPQKPFALEGLVVEGLQLVHRPSLWNS